MEMDIGHGRLRLEHEMLIEMCVEFCQIFVNAALVWPIVSLVSTSICSVDLMLGRTILI